MSKRQLSLNARIVQTATAIHFKISIFVCVCWFIKSWPVNLQYIWVKKVGILWSVMVLVISVRRLKLFPPGLMACWYAYLSIHKTLVSLMYFYSAWNSADFVENSFPTSRIMTLVFVPWRVCWSVLVMWNVRKFRESKRVWLKKGKRLMRQPSPRV